MRRIVAFDRVSADGYFARPDGRLDWVVPEEELDRAAAAGLGGSDTLLFGHRTYQMFESFWPHVGDDDPHAPGRHTPEIRAMARWINAVHKVVFSRTRREVTWNNSRLLPEFDPVQVRAMKDEPGGDIMIFGSGSIVSQLTGHGLVDEYTFVVSPLLLGTGRPLVSNVPHALKLDLIEAKSFPSGNVRLRYTLADRAG